MPKRFDPEDTVDEATHLLHRLQADGLAVLTTKIAWDWSEPIKGSQRLPVRATVTIELIPTRG